MEKLLEKAFVLAKIAHYGQKDKSGEDYIKHPVRVAASLGSEQEKIVALLHDVVEDTCVGLFDLHVFGFPPEVVIAVDCISKMEQETNANYLERVKSNPLATRVKIADILDNSDPVRIQKLSDSDQERLTKKYKEALDFLKS